jgi:hypothetical protein
MSQENVEIVIGMLEASLARLAAPQLSPAA